METESGAREAGDPLPCHWTSYQLVSGNCPQVRPKRDIIAPSIKGLASAWPQPITHVTPSAASARPWSWRSLRCFGQRNEVFSYRQVLWWAPLRAFKSSGLRENHSQADAALIEPCTPDGGFLNPLDYSVAGLPQVPEG